MKLLCKIFGHKLVKKYTKEENKEPTFVIKTIEEITCKRCDMYEKSILFSYEMFKK
jgi:hypothetical protein